MTEKLDTKIIEKKLADGDYYMKEKTCENNHRRKNESGEY